MSETTKASPSPQPPPKRRKIARIIAIVFALVLCAGAGRFATKYYVSTRGPAVAAHTPAPEFNLPDHHGQTIGLTSLLDKGPAVVVFYRGYW